MASYIELVYDWGMSGELDELAEAVDALDLPVATDVLAEVIAIGDQLQAKIARLTAQVDACGLVDSDGATSTTAWLIHSGSMTRGRAIALVATSRRMRQLPVTAAAWARGALSSGQVQVILANISEHTVAMFAAGEDEFVPTLENLTFFDTITAMQEWRRRAEAQLPDPPFADEPDRSFHHSQTLDARFESKGSYDADGGSVIAAALRLASTPDAEGESRTPAERRADAEIAIHQFFLDHQQTHRGGRRRPHLDVVVSIGDDGDVEGRLIDGPFLSTETIKRLLCDCAVHRVVTDGRSSILDYGMSTRTVPVNLFNALVLRDQHCRHPGCDRPPDWCDAHHVIPWEEDGPTDLDNLVLKCRRHHVLGHQPSWHDKLLPDGTYVVTAPDGRVFESRLSGILAA